MTQINLSVTFLLHPLWGRYRGIDTEWKRFLQ